jgi:uncharacterized protein (TIGR02453 family)
MTSFGGFQPQLLEFLANLRANNSREWFSAHRADYERYVLEPTREFVTAIGACLVALGGDIHAEPKVHGSIFAINRDTRFSPDKTPYKTHLDLWFWQGEGPSRERPGYFFRLLPEKLILGAGMHAFSDRIQERYRAAVLGPHGGRLEHLAVPNIGGRTYKRVPAGLPADHPRADWLRHSGLYGELGFEPPPEELFSPALPAWCTRQFERVMPLQQWLLELLDG